MTFIEAEVCSRLAACSSVRWEGAVVLVEISVAALATSRAADMIEIIVSCSCLMVALKSCLICP